MPSEKRAEGSAILLHVPWTDTCWWDECFWRPAELRELENCILDWQKGTNRHTIIRTGHPVRTCTNKLGRGRERDRWAGEGGGGLKGHDGNPHGSAEVAPSAWERRWTRGWSLGKAQREEKSPQTHLELFSLKNQKETVNLQVKIHLIH